MKVQYLNERDWTAGQLLPLATAVVGRGLRLLLAGSQIMSVTRGGLEMLAKGGKGVCKC